MKIEFNKNITYALVALAIVTFGIYFQVLNNDFVNIDDYKLILDNKIVNDTSIPATDVFKWGYRRAHYKPLTFLTWRIEHSLVGREPFLYHLNNLLLHLANVILVFFIGLKILSRFFDEDKKIQLGAFIFAMIFATHPLHVESVAWATERKDVLFSLFFLSSWLAYLHFLKSRKYWIVILAALLYFLSLLSKSMGLTLIAVLFITDYLYNRKLSFKLITEKIPVIIVFGLGLYLYGLLDGNSKDTAGLTFVAEEGARSTYDILNNYSPYLRRIIKISFRFLLWIGHILVPVKLSLVYPKNEMLNFFGKGLVAMPFIIATLGILMFFIRKKYKVVFWGFLYFIITISPAITISETGLAVFLPDRYTYTPMIGIALIVAVYATKYSQKYRNATYGVLAVMFIFLSVKTYQQVKVWENTGTLWSNVIKHTFCHAEAYNTRASYYKDNGEIEAAIDDYSTAMECDPNLPQPYYGRALIYFHRQEYEKSLDDFNQYIKVKRKGFDAEVYANRAAVLSKVGQNEKAIEDLNKALEIEPDYFTGYLNRAVIYRDMGKLMESVNDWTNCIRLRPNEHLYYSQRGNIYYKLKDYNKSLSDFSKVIELNPNDGASHLRKAYSLFMLKRFDEAKSSGLKAQEAGIKVEQRFWDALARMQR